MAAKPKKKSDKLTENQEKFVQGVIKGLSYAEAYRQAHPNTKMNDDAIYVEASNMINATGSYSHRPKVRSRFLALNAHAMALAAKKDKKKIADAAEVLKFLTAVMRNELIYENIEKLGYIKEKIIADCAEPKSIDRLYELRVSNIARYTENFTPPTEPFSVENFY